METGKELKDETEKIFINCSGRNIDEYPLIRPFAEYVNGKKSEDGYIRQLEEEVRKAKMNPLWRSEFMDLRSKLYHERKEGREEGKKERETELIQSLSKKGKSPEEIAELLDLSLEQVVKTLNEQI